MWAASVSDKYPEPFQESRGCSIRLCTGLSSLQKDSNRGRCGETKATVVRVGVGVKRPVIHHTQETLLPSLLSSCLVALI